MRIKFDIKQAHFYSGALAGLSTKTALVKLNYQSSEKEWKQLSKHFARAVDDLIPVGLAQASQSTWVNSYLMNPVSEVELGDWVVGLTVAMQRLAGDPVWKGRVIKAEKGELLLAIPWERKETFKFSIFFALKHIVLWSKLNKGIVEVEAKQLDVEYSAWLTDAQQNGLSPNTLRFAISALKRGIPITRVQKQVQLGYGINAIRLDGSFTNSSTLFATKVAKNKWYTNYFLRENYVPVPNAIVFTNLAEAKKQMSEMSQSLVVKPLDQDMGLGVTTNINNVNKFEKAFLEAKKFSKKVLVEDHVTGDDHRILVVAGRYMMATRRLAGGVIGNGEHSIEELISQLNEDPKRSYNSKSMLIKIILDDEASDLLAEQSFNIHSIPEKGCSVRLRHTSNISRGGTVEDVSDIVHPDNRLAAVRAAQLIGLDIAGVDFITPDISKSWREVGGAIIEVNADPGLRVHWVSQPERDINGEIIDVLLEGKVSRIPTAAITGTNGKTTTAKMLHKIWMVSGKNAAVCATNGVWIGDNLISNDNLSGNPGGKLLLNDPTVEAAIIEMPRKGLLVFGHPVDQYDVAALLNIQDDHIGAGGINSLKDMAHLKSEVLERAKNAIVINAEDALCREVMAKFDKKKLIMVSTLFEQPHFKAHFMSGGVGVFLKEIAREQCIVMAKGGNETVLMPVTDIPAALDGLATFNVSNAMFAAALAWGQKIPFDVIRQGLKTFVNSVETNPGRMNFIKGFPFKLLLDYSHNPDTFYCLAKVVKGLKVKGRKRILIKKIGNRHRSHFKDCAISLAETFDEFIVSCNPDSVKASGAWGGLDPVGLMLKSCRQDLLDVGVLASAITIEAADEEAVALSIETTSAEDLLVLLAEPGIALPVIESSLR